MQGGSTLDCQKLQEKLSLMVENSTPFDKRSIISAILVPMVPSLHHQNFNQFPRNSL